MEFTESQWRELAEHAVEAGLTFLSTAFCKPAVDLLMRVGVPAWKVGSGEYNSTELVYYMAETGLPVLLSTGMSTYDEIEEAVATVKDRSAPYAIFQCTSKYPTELEDVGLNVLEELQETFGCPVGLSDHSGNIYPGLAAILRGVDLLEVHVTFDHRMFHPDGEASITFDELETLVTARDAIHTMEENPVDKDEMATRLENTRALFSKSIAPREELPEGATLTEDMIIPKKPGTGIPYEERNRVIGRTLVNDVSPNRLLTRDDLDG
jgi:N-acetylneuraminate synthase